LVVEVPNLHGVAVGRRAHRAADADGARSSGDVLDDDRLAEAPPHAFGEKPRQHIGCAARRERHDQRHRPRRIALRCCDRHSRKRREQDCTEQLLHCAHLLQLDVTA
jgi:hypothetical protein